MYVVLCVLNSSFGNNWVKVGGVINVYSKYGMIEFLFLCVNFIVCVVEKYGCVVLVGDFKSVWVINWIVIFKLIVNFIEVFVNNCFGMKVWCRRKCNVFYFFVFSGKMIINDFFWINNRVRIDVIFLLGNVGGKIDIIVLNCDFVNNFVFF